MPELTSFKNESETTIKLYGDKAEKPGTFAATCLLARRLVERGTRFVSRVPSAATARLHQAAGNIRVEVKTSSGKKIQADTKRRVYGRK